MSMQLPSKKGEFKAQLQILLPPGYQEEDRIAFPTVFQMYFLVYYCNNDQISVCRYGGPSSQLVSYQWKVDWASFLSSSKGYVFISLDVRGSGYQGDNHRKVVHRQLSKLEVGDILYVIR